MVKLNLEVYFKNPTNIYYTAEYITTIIEKIFGTKLSEVKKIVANTKIRVTKEQIEEYLNKVFEKEDAELKKRMENYETTKDKKMGKLTDKDMAYLTQKFADNLRAEKYHFESYTLDYFNKYTTIVRKKALLLINIIEKIEMKETDSIKNILNDLDIQLDDNGDILKKDLIRLIEPLIYNINKLIEKVNMGNDLNTYLNFNQSIYRNGCEDEQLYPPDDIQVKSLYYSKYKGNVALSIDQENKIKRGKKNVLKKVVNKLKNI